MLRLMCRWISLLVLITGSVAIVHGQESLWVFEGLITKADPKLAPDLQSGWVLSGSFNFTALELEEEIPVDANRAGRFSGGIRDGELTIDLYHQLHFEAFQVMGLAGFDYQDNDPEENGRDLYGWFIPMRGGLKESGWASRWLQVWQSDSEGRMIHSVPPSISPYGIKAETSWFRLTFENEEGAIAFIEGRLDYFGPLTGRDDDWEEDWRSVASKLSDQLVERDRTITELREKLSHAHERIDSLRRMVDLMVEERRNLEEENRLLEEQARNADPEIETTISGLNADKALLEDELNSLSNRNVSLAESLAESEQLRWKLVRDLEASEQALLEASSVTVDESNSPGIKSVEAPDDQAAEIMMIVEHPMVIENPAEESTEIRVEKPFSPAPESVKQSRKPRHMGPRRFR